MTPSLNPLPSSNLQQIYQMLDVASQQDALNKIADLKTKLHSLETDILVGANIGLGIPKSDLKNKTAHTVLQLILDK